MKTIYIFAILFSLTLGQQACYRGGCSNQLCTDEPNAISTCEWTDAYACYDTATCERQSNGQCGWTNTPELEQCLANPSSSCYIGGCSGQYCTNDPNLSSTCEWIIQYACYVNATCEQQSDGQCGWTNTPEFQACLANPPGSCYKTGCSGQICSDAPNVASTCEWTNAYACYASAACERQSAGQCGWTSTPELQACLANPPVPID